MKTLVLAAGISKRLKPLEDKNFLEFLGHPLIYWQVERLKKTGIKDILVIGGAHNMFKLENLFKEDKEVQVIEQKDLNLGMAGAVISAEPHLKGDNSMLVVSSNDILDESAYKMIIEASNKTDKDGYILGYEVKEYFPGGYLEIDKENHIKSIVEKPSPGTEPSNLINLVVHYHKDASRLIGALKGASTDKDDIYEVALDALIKNGANYEAIHYQDYWQAIKYPWHIFEVWKYLFSKAEKKVADSAEIHKNAIISGDVIIDEDVRIFANAVINGPCYIGKGTMVANNALIRDSHIGPLSMIGYSTELARSYLLKEVWTHSNYVGDSIIGKNVSFGAGAVTGNLRLDEEEISVNINNEAIPTGTTKFGIICGNHVRFGINTSLMPGIKIGTNVIIGSGLVIGQDIPDHNYVSGETKLSMMPNRITVDNLSREHYLKSIKKES